MTNALLVFIAGMVLVNLLVAIWILKEIDMANENAAQEDADIVALTTQITTFLAALAAFLAGLTPPTVATLTDAQQADLDALKASAVQLSTALPVTSTTGTP